MNLRIVVAFLLFIHHSFSWQLETEWVNFHERGLKISSQILNFKSSYKNIELAPKNRVADIFITANELYL